MSGIIERLEAEIDELKEKVERLEGDGWITFGTTTGPITLKRPIKSPQEQRDEIVERAKADVEALSTTWRPGCPSLNYPPSAFNPALETVNFSINNDKRTVVCYITYKSPINGGTHTSFRGIAKCAPNDCFNAHIGKAVALRRALGLDVPDEYLTAPQPTEKRPGNVVYIEREDEYRTIASVKNTPGIFECHPRSPVGIRGILVDDSREVSE
ncbi:hypothetical protein [Alteribacter populi]|uniref:hypothetical protein n=1 Tax=Alteribacter populi TaxID=2011011 RepID=UPI000BBB4C52|nr:hypothetical protein [Alteribacter populi]